MDEAAVRWGSPWGALTPASSEAANLRQPRDLVGACSGPRSIFRKWDCWSSDYLIVVALTFVPGEEGMGRG